MTNRAHHGLDSASREIDVGAGPRDEMAEGTSGRTQDSSGWLIVRRDGSVATAERRACDLLGAPDPDSLTGRQLTFLFAAPDSPETIEARRAVASGGTWQGQLRFRYARQEVALAVSIAPVAHSSELIVISLQPAPTRTGAARDRAAPQTPPPPPPSPSTSMPPRPRGEPQHAPRPANPSGPQSAAGQRASAPNGEPRQRLAGLEGLKALVGAYDAIHDLEYPSAVARSVLQALETALSFEWAAVLRYHPGTPLGVPLGVPLSVEVVATYPTPMVGVTRGARWAPAEADEELVYASGEPSIQGDLRRRADGVSPLGRLPAFGMRSRILIPLYGGTEVTGALALFRTGSLAFTAADGILAERTVRRLGEVLRREAPQQAGTERGAAPATPLRAVPPSHDVEEDEPPTPTPSTEPRFAPPTLVPVERAQEEPPAASGTRREQPEAPRPTEEPDPLAEASSMVGHRLESLGELVAGVAHELNNPLTAILGYAQILGGLEGGEREHALSTIEDEAQRAARIVRNLLSFARQRPGQRQLVNVEEILRRVIDLRRYALEVDDVRVVTRLGMVPDVLVDEGQFEQVFLNLLNNAQQALHGRGGEVVVSTWFDEEHVYVSIADNGPGVPEEVRDRIFEPFFTTKEVGLGQGMGLAIVYGVVTHHGGRTWVEENPSGGATFVVELPLPSIAPPPPSAAPDAGTSTTTAPGNPAIPPPITQQPITQQPTTQQPTTARPRSERLGRHVLVIDGEGAVRALAREILSATGYEVDTAADAAQALALIEGGAFDLVIVDLRQPGTASERDAGLDGAGLYRRITERRPDLRGRVLFVTGDIEGEPAAHALDPAAARFVEKPFTTRQLLNAVHEILGPQPTRR